jgi:hypothetical protein
METIFLITSFAPGPVWLLLFFAPRHRVTTVAADILIFAFAALYAAMVLPELPRLFPVIASPELESIRALLATNEGTVPGWVHWIIADVWLGRWICFDCLRLGVPHVVRVPLLLATLFFGPLGLLAYLIVRAIWLRASPVPFYSNGQKVYEAQSSASGVGSTPH